MRMPEYETKLFCDIYNSAEAFLEDYENLGIPTSITTTNCSMLYYLLFARHGNDPIANFDETQFKIKLFTMVWQYGPMWEKKISIQSDLRALELDDLREGSLSVSNHATNPATTPSTAAFSPLGYIDSQSATKGKLGPVDAYLRLWNMLDASATDEFLVNFDKLFKKFVEPGTYLYVTKEDEDDEA